MPPGHESLTMVKSVEMAELLINNGADPNVKTGGVHEGTGP